MLAELPVKSGLRSYGGLQRIVSERRFYIHVDDKLNPADPWVAIEVKGMPRSIGFYSSDEPGNDAWQ